MYLQLIINPGSTSTKLAVYRGEEKLIQENLVHDSAQLAQYKELADQAPMRMACIREFLAKNGIEPGALSAVMGRGGLLPGLKAGGYRMNEDLKVALSGPLSSPHASNLGGILAYAIAEPLGIPAYIYDAVTSAELPPIARITGTPEVTRTSFCHALNARAQAIAYAEKIGRPYEDLHLIVAHLGGGISLSAHAGGRIVESIGDDEGPFSPERLGSIPLLQMLEMCYNGQNSKADMKKKIRGRGGLMAHLGTADAQEVQRRIADGDPQAKAVYEAMAYQVAKGIGLLAASQKGRVDAIILTGGIAYSELLTGWIRDYVSFIAPVAVLPGENEMQALALGGLRLLKGQEAPHIYTLPEGYDL